MSTDDDRRGPLPMPSRVALTHRHPLSASWPKAPRRTGTSPSRLHDRGESAPQRVHHPQEDTLPLVPRQESIHQPTRPADDLARHQDNRIDEPPEFHPQQPPLL